MNAAKRVADIIVAGILLALVLPVLAGVALVVRVCLGRPVFFRQVRAGRHGSTFRIVKFRTMCELREAGGRLAADEKRLGRAGRFLRAMSLDELPELWNVLKGDMSLVGPRPLLVEYLDRYTPEQARRHEVRPGITGLAQVSGRNALSWDERLALDVWYVDHQSLWLDLKILFLTVWKVFRREGISSPGHATTPEFMGTKASQEDS